MNVTALVKPTEIVQYEEPRLPYHEDITNRFGIDAGGWRVLVEAVFPSAKSFDAIVMALSYCKARNLDVFKKPVHIVPMWSTQKGGYIETIWPSIAELRTTAFRTGNYAGCDPAEFGPIIEKTFSGRIKKWVERKETWVDDEATVKFPEWCRVTIYRELSGRICKFVGPKVVWLESYAAIGKSAIPNEMWQERPEGQLEKCGEAAALRRAFPEELGNDYTAEEMAGRRVFEDRPAAQVQQQHRDDDEVPPAPPPIAQITKHETPLAPAMTPIKTTEPTFADLVDDTRDDNPPDPSSRQEPGQSRSMATGPSPAAAPDNSVTPAAGEALSIKMQLLKSMGECDTLLKLESWLDENGRDMSDLEGAEQREVESAYNKLESGLRNPKKK